ncbi:MAG: HelD family protein, partial [Blautia sp.]
MEEMTAYLGEILDKLRERIEKIDRSLEEGEREIEQMHTYYWENYTEMDQYGYENYDNQQALLGQVNANQEQRLLRHRLCRMLDSPFFGRVDFAYEGEEKPETFYIGIGNFSQETGQVPLIYDWRAPVSSLFYDYDKGPACYQAPGGRMDGEVWAKWQYKIRSGKLVYAFESDVKIDDEVLQEELGTHGDVKLKNIIRTIQKEQNAIIRNTKDPVLVIQGVAGSGKTSVALHRIAYLLYHDRENLKSSNVLILSPNQVFSDYISRILPELGEENIQEMSFDLFAYRELQDVAADCEEKYD